MMLARCKKELENEWRKRYRGLFEKIQHPQYGLVDFDEIYAKLITSDNSPITLILNLYLEDEIIPDDTIYSIVMSELTSIFYPH